MSAERVQVRMSPFPAWVLAVHHVDGRVIKRFKTAADCDAWLERHGYEVEHSVEEAESCS